MREKDRVDAIGRNENQDDDDDDNDNDDGLLQHPDTSRGMAPRKLVLDAYTIRVNRRVATHPTLYPTSIFATLPKLIWSAYVRLSPPFEVSTATA